MRLVGSSGFRFRPRLWPASDNKSRFMLDVLLFRLKVSFFAFPEPGFKLRAFDKLRSMRQNGNMHSMLDAFELGPCCVQGVLGFRA